MAEVIQSGGSRGHKGKKKGRRLGVRLDMTPMVDVAFLLLTFFMLTTTLITPQVMEISLPPDSKVEVQIAESNLLTFRVRKDHTVFWNKGSEAPQKVDMAKIRELLTNQLKGNSNLATLIKVDRDAKYQVLVDLMDDLNIAIADSRTTAKRFSIVAMDDKDQAMVNAL